MTASLFGGPLTALCGALLLASGPFWREQTRVLAPAPAPAPALPQEVQVTCHCPARECEPSKACEPCVPAECSCANAWSASPTVQVVTGSAGFALGLAWGIVVGASAVGTAVAYCPRRSPAASRGPSTRGLVALRDW